MKSIDKSIVKQLTSLILDDMEQAVCDNMLDTYSIGAVSEVSMGEVNTFINKQSEWIAASAETFVDAVLKHFRDIVKEKYPYIEV